MEKAEEKRKRKRKKKLENEEEEEILNQKGEPPFIKFKNNEEK